MVMRKGLFSLILLILMFGHFLISCTGVLKAEHSPVVPSVVLQVLAWSAGSKLSWPPEITGLLHLQVFGDKDADGFYRGEGGGRMGYIPCNMVAEVAVDSPAGRQQLLQQGYLSPDVLVEGPGMTCSCPSPTSCHPISNSNPGPTPTLAQAVCLSGVAWVPHSSTGRATGAFRD